jgi:hypothetical protein
MKLITTRRARTRTPRFERRGGALLEGLAAGDRLEDHDGQAPQVEALIGATAIQCLGRHVQRRAEEAALRSRFVRGAACRHRLRRVESEYYAKQAASADALYLVVGGLALLAGIGAAFGATNTLYATVQARTREIGTLRALGFSRAAIASSFLLESLLIAVSGFAVGALLAWLAARLVSAAIGDISVFATSGVSWSRCASAWSTSRSPWAWRSRSAWAARCYRPRAARAPVDALRKG